ncbi:MAG: hypothetical protein KUG79_12530 [Pseudomonadales bacterium]|nr:hypothetical protein [Pseudomonadales bacterium]
MKYQLLLIAALACLSGCASTIQLGNNRHDIGFLWLKENKQEGASVAELRRLGISFYLGKQTGLMLGYQRNMSLSPASPKANQETRALLMGKLTSRAFDNDKGYFNRIGLFWIKVTKPQPLLVNTTAIGAEMLAGSTDGNAMLGYQQQVKMKSIEELNDVLVCIHYSSLNPMETNLLITPAPDITERVLLDCNLSSALSHSMDQ